MTTAAHPQILVLGGLNMGLITRTARLPEAGETLPGERFYHSSGGKGATQAVAAVENSLPRRPGRRSGRGQIPGRGGPPRCGGWGPGRHPGRGPGCHAHPHPGRRIARPLQGL